MILRGRAPGCAAAPRPNQALPPVSDPFVSQGRAQAARGESLAAFDGRCILDGGVAPRPNIPDLPGRRALPLRRLTRLDATPDFHHGPPGVQPADPAIEG